MSALPVYDDQPSNSPQPQTFYQELKALARRVTIIERATNTQAQINDLQRQIDELRDSL